MRNPIKTHWRGRYTLLPTLLLTALALRLLMGVVQKTIPTGSINLWVVFSVGIFLWQIVGSSRATDRFLKESGNIVAVFAAYFVLLVVGILTVFQVADAMASKYEPESFVTTSLTLPVQRDKQLIRVDGNLNWELFSAFEETLEMYPDIEGVELSSGGGYVFVARAMALKILEHKLNTHVDTHCYSACTIAFLAGQRRTMASNARLGFHRYKLESTHQPDLIDVSEELEKDRLFFAERGLSDAFIKQVFTAGHAELWKPNMVSLIKGGVLVD